MRQECCIRESVNVSDATSGIFSMREVAMQHVEADRRRTECWQLDLQLAELEGDGLSPSEIPALSAFCASLQH